MQIGDQLELDITDVAFGGAGVARHVGQVVFIPLVLTGERVEAVITGITARFARGECRRVLVPSSSRVTPPCPHFGVCGGCRYQHADYPLQLQMKRKQVADILQRIGGFAAPPVEAMTASPIAYGYRNKLTLHGPGRPGFQRSGGGSLLPINRCALACEAINRKLNELATTRLKIGEDLIVRGNAAGKVFSYRESTRRPISAARSCASEQAAAMIIEESLAGFSFRVPAQSFFQVNHGVHELLLTRVSRLFEECACPNLVDAYCGVGAFALALAGQAKRVIGIESDPAALTWAIENAARMGVIHGRFRHGRVERLLQPALRESAAEPTCVILDPPRAGCDERVIRVLMRERPRQILYLSCVPPILARDLKKLRSGGYELKRVIPCDMFPQTAHCEVIAELIFPK
ncbi:MAG: class I SAM-dependent RNA methyltransferase [Verrucomicrobia bacterium]|nr:class I SAM-dependent RNA methyltransferase [Verrucomicrobiota bacterium]MBU4427803.1 class I SAM-dependent RNA methyltransferase [Verrucomicrobiota bacterium]MCG2681370.1 class I SAM-dependent RNA methyltransferase [Kiritimatiellia bacterium]